MSNGVYDLLFGHASQEVKEPHQHEWYKRLYQTIHKQKSGGNEYILFNDSKPKNFIKF